jgi:predicted enzyme related to lactoylglutathione lyase
VSLGKVEAAGGKVLMDKISIGENGFIAFFLDTEGNRVGLHSMG